MMQITQGNVGAPWHQSYHASASTTDLSGYDAGFLRKSPDQYSSRGSMESLDHPHPGYSSCNQLSVSKSSNSIDHLHSKRDSAYSSFSTSSSIPEYLTAVPSITKERSYSMESVPQHKTAEGMNQADIRYVRTVYDSQQGVSKEHEVPSSVLMKTGEGKAQSRSGIQDGLWQHTNSSGSSGSSASNGCGTATSHRHSAGPVWGQTHNHNSYENLAGVPSPPLRSDSFAAFRNHERPNSWSSLEQARSLRALHKGSWHHSSGSVASGKSSFGIEGQLHTVIEKSPESSPTTKPKQNFPASSQPGLAMLPTGIYPVSLPEPHFAQIPNANPSSGGVYPALLKENKHIPQRENGEGSDSGVLASHSSSVQPKESNLVQDDPQTKFMFYRSHFQTQGSNSTVPCTGQDRKDPYTTVQPRRDMMESHRQPREEEPSRIKEHPQKPEVVQGHVLQVHESEQRVSSLGRYHNDFNTHQQRDQDLDHPLTRLENALAEVQRCASPQSTASHCSVQSERTMSVMEKVSHFERQQAKPRSYSSLSSYSSSAVSSQVTRSDKRSLNGLEDLQNHCLSQGRSWSSSHEGKTQAQQDMQPRYGSTNQSQHRKPHDLQRSKSFFQLSENNDNNFHRSKSIFHLGEENNRDVQLQEDLRGILGTGQETTFNRAYRDSIKDAQSKVLRSTSFRRRDLSVNPPPVPEKQVSVERKAAQTNPNPKISTSPHTPKERHIVPVEVPNRNIAPELPRVPPVGPSVMRICGRKRLTMEQKKRSYSEPENMNEVGVSDQRSGPIQRNAIQPFQFPEASVADRRRMFELVASRNVGSKLTTSRPELKQMQQEALADYVERKTGRRMDGHLHRPQSACIQSVASSSMDIHSLGSTPSLSSLQQPGQEGVSSALSGSMKRLMQPNSITQTEIYHSGYNPQGQLVEPQKPEKEPEKRPFLFHVPARASDHLPSTSGAFQRTVPSRRSGKSTSAEDLLEHTEDRPLAQHSRSRSTPAVENYSQDFLPEDLTIPGIVSEEHSALGSKQISFQVHMEKNPGPYQSNPPVKRRERQRHSDRPRAHSASGLAASVGLPCPFSPPEWQSAGERQCQPNLDSITFPGTVHEQLEDALKDVEKIASHLPPSPLQVTGSHTPFSFDQIPQSYLQEPSTTPNILVSPTKSLPSLRISESSIHFGPLSAVTQEDDDVFLTPSSSLSPQLANSEANLMEDLPCASVQPERMQEPPDVARVQETQTLNSFSERQSITTPDQERDKQLRDLSSLSVISNQNSTKVTTGVISESLASESLSLKLPLLVRRERTEAEVRVEALARELVCNDEALAPLLDSWASTSTLDLMEDIFFSSSWSPLHSGESSISHTGDSSAQVVQAAAKNPVKSSGIETDLDEEENNLKQKKMELVQALATSLEILQVERSSLAEEQQHFSALGGRMEELIQQHCKPNESEKYRMFIGDLEKIVNLLLSLSGRLARVENALNALGEEPDKGSAEEKASLQQKQQQLRSQQEDARELKENLDRRERIVLQFLGGYLSKAELHDYQSYIRTKPALLIRQRHLDELIQQGEEQLRRLSENTTPEAYPHLDSTRSSPTSGSNSPRPTTVTSL